MPEVAHNDGTVIAAIDPAAGDENRTVVIAGRPDRPNTWAGRNGGYDYGSANADENSGLSLCSRCSETQNAGQCKCAKNALHKRPPVFRFELLSKFGTSCPALFHRIVSAGNERKCARIVAANDAQAGEVVKMADSPPGRREAAAVGE
jgi:hypothetical protein